MPSRSRRGSFPAQVLRESDALPDAERRRRRRDLVITAAVIVAIAAVVLVERRLTAIPQALPFGDSLLFLFLNAFSVVLIVLLVYLIGRHFVKLVFERRQGILGSHLNLKFVFALFVVAAVPMAVQYAISSSFITASIDTWFSLQMDRAIEDSREVADAYYNAWAENALHFGEQISQEITRERMLREGERDALGDLIQAKQREYNLGVVQVFPFAESEPIATLVNPEIPTAAFVNRDSAIVASALDGERASVVDATGTEIGDVIRGAVPIRSSDPDRPDEIVGAVVVNHLVPHSLVYKVGAIRSAVEEYRAVQPFAGQIAGVYQLVLLLFSLVVVLFALWWGLRMARGVTGPLRALAEGTEQVARGNLNVEVQSHSDDEVGVLVRSFNKMTRDLREALSGLEQSNAELDRRRRYMEIVLRNVDAGVVSVDAEGRVHTINPAAQRLLGVPPGTGVIGAKLEEVLSRPEYLEIVRDLMQQTRPGVRESVRQQVQVPEGDEVRTLLVTLTLLQDYDGQPIGSVLVFDDYTQEVRAQRMAAWREVARRIAHEIKNPLTPIQLSAQRIRRRFRGRLGADGEDARIFDECVDTIVSQVDGLKVLVNEFSSFARLPAARPRPDDLNELVQEAVSSYAGTEGVAFETELDPSLPRVELDREQIRRVLTNLIENARTAVAEESKAAGSESRPPRSEAEAERSPEAGEQASGEARRAQRAGGERSSQRTGRVQVSTVHDAPLQTVRLEIADDGPGIPEEDRRRIFEPYFSTKQHGTGLGLAIVSRIVADHHGYIRVHANRPRGTRFIVELPVRSA